MLRRIVAILACAAIGATAFAQDPKPPAPPAPPAPPPPAAADEPAAPQANPEALKAFTDMVKTWRAMPGLGVKTAVKIEMMEGDVSAHSDEVKGEFVFGPNRQAIIKLRGFTVYLTKEPGAENGTFTAVHEKDDHDYFTSGDDGSPYYAVFAGFYDMPFPELAIMLGEDDIGEVLQQFHQKAPMLQPTAVAMEQKDGKDVEHLTLSCEFTRFDLFLDPTTKLINSAEMDISGGDLVQKGTTLVYKYAYEYEPHDRPLEPGTFKLDPGQRQKVDLMAALLPRPEPAAEQGGIAEQNALVGKPAPPVTLARADGKAFDLADMHGRVVVLDFWASWCGPCMMGLPKVHEAAKWASDEQLPVMFMTVNVWEIRGEAGNSPDARLASARKTWEAKGFTLPIAMDYSDQTAAAYGVQGIPTTVIVRSDGIVHAVHVGVTDVEDLKKDIQAAIKAVEPGM